MKLQQPPTNVGQKVLMPTAIVLDDEGCITPGGSVSDWSNAPPAPAARGILYFFR
jgi:hypothetical protein